MIVRKIRYILICSFIFVFLSSCNLFDKDEENKDNFPFIYLNTTVETNRWIHNGESKVFELTTEAPKLIFKNDGENTVNINLSSSLPNMVSSQDKSFKIPAREVHEIKLDIQSINSNLREKVTFVVKTKEKTVTINLDIVNLYVAEADENADFNDNPLYREQWHLNNTGQSAYAARNGTSSNATIFSDLNLRDINKKYIGRGVRVRVVDSGLDAKHPDLNVSKLTSCALKPDGTCLSSGIAPRSPRIASIDDNGDHGTSVAGIIGMKDNEIGGVGVAPGVILSGYDFLNGESGIKESQTAATWLASMGKGTNGGTGVIGGIPDVLNMSFGTAGAMIGESDSDFAVFQAGVEDGIIYIKSSGNHFSASDSRGLLGDYDCDEDKGNFACTSSGNSGQNNLPQNIVVGAMNADGEKSSYSSTGPNLWIMGFGGEYGNNASSVLSNTMSITDGTVVNPSLYNKIEVNYSKPSGAPAMITADISGCKEGYSKKIEVVEGPSSLAKDSEYVLPWWWNNIMMPGLRLGYTVSDFNYPLAYSIRGKIRFNISINSNLVRSEDYIFGKHYGYKEENGKKYSVPHPDNQNCDYTNSFNGTSSAAPTVSGVVALMKEAWPNINNREVKNILAQTQRKPDLTNKGRKIINQSNPAVYPIEQGWIENQAGYKFNDYYGFGVIDAYQAVTEAASRKLAEANGVYNQKSIKYAIGQDKVNNYLLLDGEEEEFYSSGSFNFKPLDKEIKDPDLGDIKQTNFSFKIDPNDISKVESAYVRVYFARNGVQDIIKPREIEFLSVEITSPSGTMHRVVKPLMTIREFEKDDYDNFTNIPIFYEFVHGLSNAFYEEIGAGEWKVTVTDYRNKKGEYSNLEASVSLILYGDK